MLSTLCLTFTRSQGIYLTPAPLVYEYFTILQNATKPKWERTEWCGLNGSNANCINVLMFLAKCPSCSVEKVQLFESFCSTILFIQSHIKHKQWSDRPMFAYYTWYLINFMYLVSLVSLCFCPYHCHFSPCSFRFRFKWISSTGHINKMILKYSRSHLIIRKINRNRYTTISYLKI